jgi:hypothetical protein
MDEKLRPRRLKSGLAGFMISQLGYRTQTKGAMEQPSNTVAAPQAIGRCPIELSGLRIEPRRSAAELK